MEHVLVIAIDYLIPLALGGVIGFMARALNGNKQQNAMLRALGRYRIKDECDAYLERGFVTPMQLDMLTDLHDAYNALNGNSVGDLYYEKVKKLKIMEVQNDD